MKKLSLISVLAFLAMAGIFSQPAVFAQSKTCSLALEVSALDENGQPKQIKNARAFAVRRNTRRRIPATLVSGSPRFSRLRVGHYRLTTLKRGFESTTQEVDFSCSAANSKIDIQVSLEPTGGFPKSVSTLPMDIPPVRRGVTTSKGTGEPAESSFPYRRDPIPPPIPKSISGGVLNGKALLLPTPVYPPIARQAHASGTVVVQVTIDETGNIMLAHAVSGHPLLQAVCVEAARKSKFSPTKLAGRPVKVTGVITYNFIAQ